MASVDEILARYRGQSEQENMETPRATENHVSATPDSNPFDAPNTSRIEDRPAFEDVETGKHDDPNEIVSRRVNDTATTVDGRPLIAGLVDSEDSSANDDPYARHEEPFSRREEEVHEISLPDMAPVETSPAAGFSYSDDEDENAFVPASSPGFSTPPSMEPTQTFDAVAPDTESAPVFQSSSPQAISEAEAAHSVQSSEAPMTVKQEIAQLLPAPANTHAGLAALATALFAPLGAVAVHHSVATFVSAYNGNRKDSENHSSHALSWALAGIFAGLVLWGMVAVYIYDPTIFDRLFTKIGLLG